MSAVSPGELRPGVHRPLILALAVRPDQRGRDSEGDEGEPRSPPGISPPPPPGLCLGAFPQEGGAHARVEPGVS